MEYLLDVKEMREYINSEYGNAQVIARRDWGGHTINRWVIQTVLMDRRGIIAFGGRHIDLWDGRKIHGEHYIQSALWEADSALTDGIFFWEVTT